MPFRKRVKATTKRRRLLFVTDLHGSELTFRKLLKALELWNPDAVIGGGDVAGKALVPIVEQGTSGYRLKWMGKEHDVSTREELHAYEAKISQLGFYPYRTTMECVQRMRDDPQLTGKIFEELIAERWAGWIERLEDRCAALGIRGFVMAGNDDPWSLDAVTFQERDWVTGADGKVLPLLDDWALLSCGLGNPTPWQCPRDGSESRLEEKLREIARSAPDFSGVVANIHVPPYGSTLDLAPKLDTTTFPPRPVAGETAPAGSTAVRTFIEEFQPLLSLHGHIHESRAAVRLGRTLAVNPGSEYAEGVLRAALITVEPQRIVSHQLVTG